MRKSIFDIASSSVNMTNEVGRIVVMLQEEKNMTHTMYYSILDFVDRFCFKSWSRRGHFVDVDDFLDAVEYKEIQEEAKQGDADAFMMLIELTYNFWLMAYNSMLDKTKGNYWTGNFFHLRDVMLDNLEKYNHKAYFNEDYVLIVEDKPEVTAVAEIVKQDLAMDIIRYNHRSLQGELALKKGILLSLGAELEPRRKELQALNKQLCEDIFFMLNNLHIRHNNRSKRDTNYKEYIAKMRNERLEKWYDELYQMMLLAFLLLDNVERTSQVKELKNKIVGGSN